MLSPVSLDQLKISLRIPWDALVGHFRVRVSSDDVLLHARFDVVLTRFDGDHREHSGRCSVQHTEQRHLRFWTFPRGS